MLSQRKEPYETFQTPDLQPSFTAKLSLIDTWVRQRLTTIAHSFIRDAFASFREEPPNNAHPAGPAGWDAEYHLRVQPQSASSDVDGPFSIYRKIGHGALNLTRITNTSAESPHYGLFRFRYTATFINPHPCHNPRKATRRPKKRSTPSAPEVARRLRARRTLRTRQR
ncbi:hypothetical protein EI94DRAFT_1729810 [Lactarius quietus]|nr:hypothetical protein EI94DRAFT_1729810 [Lactarius quietus]